MSWRGDLYAVLGDDLAGGGFVVRLYFNPLVRLIWLGALVMALGGALSLSDRRLRIGAPRRARRAGPSPPPPRGVTCALQRHSRERHLPRSWRIGRGGEPANGGDPA